ncbi:MAG: hypothetical protein K2U26_15750, partial [Cyclobacteriaceae bacterium]|nr:hypothetical protein [Cyclobacteriaceae bacterium]
NTHIDAVELQAEDAQQAIENVKLSPWPEKISVIHTSLQAFDMNRQYEVIVCNPPYFSKSLLPPKDARAIARHDETLRAIDLIQAAKKLLAPSGVLSIILPCQEALQFSVQALEHDLFLTRHTRFYSRATKLAERSLMEFSRIHSPVIENELVLYSENNEWTTDYSRLTGDFYLDRPARLSKNL